jgi:hypothetical protein
VAFSTTSLVESGRETGWASTIDQLMCWGCSREPCFSGVVTLSNSIGVSQKVTIRGLHDIYMVEGHTWTERGKCVACWSGFFPIGCTLIRIVVTHGYEYRLFVVVMT